MAWDATLPCLRLKLGFDGIETECLIPRSIFELLRGRKQQHILRGMCKRWINQTFSLPLCSPCLRSPVAVVLSTTKATPVSPKKGGDGRCPSSGTEHQVILVAGVVQVSRRNVAVRIMSVIDATRFRPCWIPTLFKVSPPRQVTYSRVTQSAGVVLDRQADGHFRTCDGIHHGMANQIKTPGAVLRGPRYVW